MKITIEEKEFIFKDVQDLTVMDNAKIMDIALNGSKNPVESTLRVATEVADKETKELINGLRGGELMQFTSKFAPVMESMITGGDNKKKSKKSSQDTRQNK